MGALALVASTLVLGEATTPASAATVTRAYVTNAGSNTVSVIDTATNAVLTTIPVGSNPDGVAVNPAGTRAYVTNRDSDTVSVIDTATNTVVATIPVGSLPVGVAVNQAGTRAYVANENSNTVSVIDTATNTVLTTIPVSSNPEGVAVNPAGTRAYVTNAISGTVSVIGTATNTVLTTIPVGSFPGGVTVNPAGTLAYVTNNVSGTVSVIDTATNTVVATIPVGRNPFGVAVNPAGTRAYVTNENPGTVSVIDTATNIVIDTVGVGCGPVGVAVSPDATRAYVANNCTDTVSVIDTATNIVVVTIPVGSGAFGVALANVVVAAPLDTTPPSCALTAVRAGPPTQIDITVQDVGSGLASVVVTQSDNATTPVPAFTSGTTDPVVVTATKSTPGGPFHVALQVTDVAGNVTTCEPAMVGVARDTGKPQPVTLAGLAPAEHLLTVANGSPGVTTLKVEVDGTALAPLHLDDGQTATLDLSSAMQPGSAHTVVLTPVGKPGGSASVLVHD